MMLIEGWYDVPLHAADEDDSEDSEQEDGSHLFQLRQIHKDFANGGKEKITWNPGKRSCSKSSQIWPTARVEGRLSASRLFRPPVFS